MHHRSVLWLIASLNAVPLILANPVGFDVGPLRYLLPRQEPPVSNANFRNCPSGFDKIVMNALQDVQTLSKAAAATGTGGKYSAWFGSEIGGLTDKQIKTLYNRLSNWINAPTKYLIFNCDIGNADTGCSRPTIHAWTTVRGSEIVLCRPWFDNPNKRLDRLTPPSPHLRSASLDEYVTQGSQLLHEMTHALYGTGDQKLTNGETAYGHKNTLIQAREDAAKARNNADNFAFFAMTAYFDRASWSTDPYNLEKGGGDL